MPAKTLTATENTRASFQGNLDKWILPALGDMKLTDITAAQISALLLDMQAKGKKTATVTKVYTILKSLFKMAYLSDMVSRNPMDKVQRQHPKSRTGTGSIHRRRGQGDHGGPGGGAAKVAGFRPPAD